MAFKAPFYLFSLISHSSPAGILACLSNTAVFHTHYSSAFACAVPPLSRHHLLRLFLFQQYFGFCFIDAELGIGTNWILDVRSGGPPKVSLSPGSSSVLAAGGSSGTLQVLRRRGTVGCPVGRSLQEETRRVEKLTVLSSTSEPNPHPVVS